MKPRRGMAAEFEHSFHSTPRGRDIFLGIIVDPSPIVAANPIYTVVNWVDCASWRFVHTRGLPWCYLPAEVCVKISSYFVDRVKKCLHCSNVIKNKNLEQTHSCIKCRLRL